MYLGYWVEGSVRLQYKLRYRPLERLTRDGWDRYSEVHQDYLIARAAALRRDAALPLDGSTKDGVQ